MTRIAITIIVILISVANIKSQTCNGPATSLTKAMTLAKGLETSYNNICKKANGKPLIAKFFQALLTCLNKWIQPCMTAKAKHLEPIVQKCTKDNKVLTASGLCTKESEAASCATDYYNANKAACMKDAMSNLPWLVKNGNEFKTCIDKATAAA